MEIFEMVSAPAIATYYTAAATSTTPYLGAVLFPNMKKAGLDLSWIKGSNGLPIALTPSEFDVKATIRDRGKIERLETEMPYFKEAMAIREKERQELLKLQNANEAYVKPMIEQIYKDRVNLINGVEVDAELMRMQLLSTGKINLASPKSRKKYTYDYGFKATLKKALTGTDKWSDTANSKPVRDILAWMDAVEIVSGNLPNGAICTRKTWGYLLENESIKKDINPVGATNVIITNNMLKQYLLNKIGINVTVYSKKYAVDTNGTIGQFFPDDVFTLIPVGSLGNTWYGTTPEEADLISGKSRAQVQIVNMGVAVKTWMEEDPVNSICAVSAITLPSFESIDSIFIATVN